MSHNSFSSVQNVCVAKIFDSKFRTNQFERIYALSIYVFQIIIWDVSTKQHLHMSLQSVDGQIGYGVHLRR